MKKPKAIDKPQYERLSYWLEGRFKVLFALAVDSGLRISDLLNLRVKDVQKNPMSVYETKSKRKRTFTVSPEVFRDLTYLTYFKRETDFVFESERDSTKHVHRSTVHRQIKKALKWLDFDCSAHSARKLYAQGIYAATGDIKRVQRALNHVKLATTLTYLDIVQQNVESGQEDATERTGEGNIFKRLIKFFKRGIKNVIAKTRN